MNIIKCDNIIYKDFWPEFYPRKFVLHDILKSRGKITKVIGPYFKKNTFNVTSRVISESIYRADFFITPENRRPQNIRAVKQIGFWSKIASNQYRFPYWMYYINYEEYNNKQDMRRFGSLYSVAQMMRPIRESYSINSLHKRIDRACLFSRHMAPPRDSLFNFVKSIIGCDGYGAAFDSTKFLFHSKKIREGYVCNLCPENSIGDGYITEKIPEAFLSGCIPIAWCRPEDLELDFNPDAVINLYGLSEYEIIKTLEQIKDPLFREKYYQEPLLLQRPSIDGVYQFICNSQ